MIGIVATPVTLLLIAGEFDLSVGTMIGAAGIAIAYPIVNSAGRSGRRCVCGFAARGGIGTLNGLMVVRMGIPSFLVTLGMHVHPARGHARPRRSCWSEPRRSSA